MDNAYVLSGQIQTYLTESYKTQGIKRDFIDALAYLHYSGQSVPGYPDTIRRPDDPDNYKERFAVQLDRLAVPVYPTLNNKRDSSVNEPCIIPDDRDTYVIKHFNYIDNKRHRHDYFEMNYVFRGCCLQVFEEEQRTLQQGEFCIIAPGSVHDIIVDDDDSVVISILIRKSTFNDAFFNLLTSDDLLAVFFKTMLYGDSLANYLLFFSEDRHDLNDIVAHLVLECYHNDSFANACCNNYAHLLFAYVLRNYHSSAQYNYYHRKANYNVDVPIILQYIQQNYRTITLSDLAAHFHYSENYLSRLIKKNTRLTFSDIVTNLKIAQATEFLGSGEYSVTKIAEMVGYESADHFSRVFRQMRGQSPNQYRKQLQKSV